MENSSLDQWNTDSSKEEIYDDIALYMFLTKPYIQCILFMVSMDNQRIAKQGKPQKKHLNKICYVVKITFSLYCVIKMTHIVSKTGFEICLWCYKFWLYHNSSYRGDGNKNFVKLWLCYDHIWHEGVIIITTYSKIIQIIFFT